MEREQIIKALECCTSGINHKGDIPCLDCPYDECNIVGGTSERQITGTCQSWLKKDALSLIKELTAENDAWQKRLISTEEKADKAYYDLACEVEDLRSENERLKNRITCQVVLPDEKLEEIKNECLSRVELDIKAIQADIVRKMQTEIEARCLKGGIYPAFVKSTIDQIVKEIMEGKNAIN